MRYLWLTLFGLLLVTCQQKASNKKTVIEEVSLKGSVEPDVPKRLSEWGLFEKPMVDLVPVSGIIPYDLNTPLFSDYAYKARFIKLPEGTSATYDSTEVMNFPDGTILIKNFYYPKDFARPEADRRILETRLLVNEGPSWNAWTYIWNEEQTEAILEIAGASIPVKWRDEEGILQSISYSVPNLVQCKGCHEKSGKLIPIGPTVRQLNRAFHYSDGTVNQLKKWEALGMLEKVPPVSDWPIIPVWDDPETGSLDERARAWLEINCAHCHRKEGPAKNTGLYLTYDEKDLYRLGINKPPVAAGRGSGGLKYSIVPGKPDQSILVHRITSLDPGVMMPEVGRKMRHEEGIELVKAWISEMEAIK